MAEAAAHGLAQMPPWGWGLLLLGSGGGIGTLSGLSLESHESELVSVEGQLQSARTSLDSANATIQSLIEVIKQKQNSGWIE
jgi:hypothetical protein